MTETHRVGAVCARTGLTPRQLRDWERRGLVRAQRGTGNQRLYGETEVAVLLKAKRMRDAGLTLADIKLTLAILGGSALGGEAEGMLQIRRVLARIRTELDLVEELTQAIRARLLRRAGRVLIP